MNFTESWDRDLSLKVNDSVAGRDGLDSVRNVQILRFADRDIVLDEESNSANFDLYNIGDAITGSLPVAVTSISLDQDYFQHLMF